MNEASKVDPSIEEFLTNYREAWWANAASQIEAAWDTGNAPFYKAEEIEHIITNWDDLRAYWQHNETFNSVNELSYSDIHAHSLSDDITLIGMRMRWDIRFADNVRNMDGSAFAWAGQTMGGDNHVMAILKHTGDSMKLAAWVEAPDAPILYMAQLYLKNVRPDFPAKQ